MHQVELGEFPARPGEVGSPSNMVFFLSLLFYFRSLMALAYIRVDKMMTVMRVKPRLANVLVTFTGQRTPKQRRVSL